MVKRILLAAIALAVLALAQTPAPQPPPSPWKRANGVISPRREGDNVAIVPTVLRGGDGQALPATCAVGDVYFLKTGTPGLYQCTATDTWTLPSGGGGKRVLLPGRAAVCQSGVAGAGVSLPASNAPTATCAADSTQAYLVFTAATAQTVYDRFELPADWAGTLKLVTTAWSTSTDPPTINACLGCVSTGATTPTITYGGAQVVSLTPAAASGRTRVSTTLTTTGCAAADVVYLKLTVTAAAAAALNVMTVQVTE